ncbi:MAG: glycosyltransferase [Eubacteriales bacterium]|nr:glycosyltransferase [Eubacteriales bacterium]
MGNKDNSGRDASLPLRVLFLIFSFHVGGIERQLVELANALAARGEEVHLCVINASYEETLLATLSSEVHLLKMERPVSGAGRMAYMWRLARYVRRWHIDVIHAQEPTGVVFSAFAKALCPALRIVETVHDVGEYREYSGMQLRLADLLCRRYVAISAAVEREIRERGIAARRVTLIHNAVNTEKFYLLQRSKPDRVGGREEEFCIGNIARFFPAKKGQDTLVRAVEILRRTYPRIHCFLAGAVYRGQDEAYRELVSYVKSHELEDHITFCGGIDEVVDFLGKIDLFVLPSNYEGFGIALIEAMATGLPCVASRLDGPLEIMGEHPELGRLFEAGDAAELAEQIAYVMEHYQEYQQNEIAAYTAATYGMDSFVEKHMALYRM